MRKQRKNSLLYGFDETGRPVWGSQPGGVLAVAGARGGKLSDFLGYNICSGICTTSMVVLDMKGELAAISQNQTPDKKHNIYINPVAMHGLGQNRVNPTDFLTIDSPTLVSDTKVFCQNWLKLSGSANASYFEERARNEFLEALVLTNVRIHGVLTLPDLYRSVNLIPAGGDEWLNFGFEMQESGFEISSRIEDEIAAWRSAPDSGGMQGILGELFKSFACLSEPRLMAMVSPPYDFSLGQLCGGDQAHHVYIIVPAENIEAWAPVIKVIFVAGMIYKSRAPQAPQQTWIIDEAAQLGSFPLLVQLFTYGAGIGIRPVALYQSTAQMKATGANAETIIPSSAAVQLYFAMREIGTAAMVSRMLGTETLEVSNAQQEARARHDAQQAMNRIVRGEDMMGAMLDYAHHQEMAGLPTKMQRAIQTDAEVLNMPSGRLFMFADGLPGAAYLNRKPYYEQRFMAGRFHPNPFHQPLDRVRVKSLIGHRWRRIIREPVPERFAHYPQYADGVWSRIG